MATQIIYLATVKHTPIFFLLVLSLSVISCNTTSHSNPDESTNTTDTNTSVSESLEISEPDTFNPANEPNAPPDYGDDFMQTLHIVIADTGNDYYQVRRRMLELNTLTNLPIDTMHRYFNSNHNRIMLPDSLEDELYGTYYFMRRYPSNSLSIEYLDHYDTTATENCMALFGGMFSDRYKADSLLQIIQPKYPKGYVLTVDMFMGCMH